MLFATTNPRVSNIALTGPYGSGKSSIIKSFLKSYRRPTLQISLAAFLPDVGITSDEVSRQEIERSILQQMLYGADANKLPRSRFKRIQSPNGSSILVSLWIALGLFSCWHLISRRNDIVSGVYFTPIDLTNWFNLVCFAIGSSFFWLALHHLYTASFGLSLKSISLKDVEITAASDTEASILNRHLDEIIYFFQRTKYDLVVIEDLDRFDNSDIFVTLREINSLVNANSGVKRKIRFLYALRDNMFTNVDRTKFFEFIIPVIPIINASNSIDKVLEQGRRLSLEDRLDRQFLRETSRYLNDLRLIQNIFNEYAIYIENLKSDDENVLNPNKLLAVLMYKNVFPRDFEDLHRGKGALANVLNMQSELVARAESSIQSEIAQIEEQITAASRQVSKDLLELRRIYMMALIEKLPGGTYQVGVDGQALIDVSNLARDERVEQIIQSKMIRFAHANGIGRTDISGFEQEVDPLKSYLERKSEVEQRSAESVSSALNRIAALRARLSGVRIAKFNEILRLNGNALDEALAEFGENSALARYLILEGHLDDTYYQYTSLFHSGRLSGNDNKFLIQIRSFVNPDPGAPIDNPKEVIAAMRIDDFRREYALNVKLVDSILGEPGLYAAHLEHILSFIADNFGQCQAFLSEYYARGTSVPALLDGLAERWDNFISTAIESSGNISHLAQIVSHLPVRSLERVASNDAQLSAYVSRSLPQLLVASPGLDPSRLKSLNVEVDDLAAIGGFPGTARFLIEEGLFKLTPANIEFAIVEILGASDRSTARTRNYTTVIAADYPPLLSRIDRDFEGYVRDVLLALEENREESISAMLKIISHEEIGMEYLHELLSRQSARLPSLEQVPPRLHASVFELSKIDPSWENCLSFGTSEEFDAEVLTDYLNTELAVAALSTAAVPDGEAAFSLRDFLVENNDLLDQAYRLYVRRLTKPLPNFPGDLSPNKLRILIEERKVTFSAESFSGLPEGGGLKSLFAANNMAAFLSSDGLTVDDDFREALLGENIDDKDRIAIIEAMDVGALAGNPTRAAILGPIVHRTGMDVGQFDSEAARTIILNSVPVDAQMALLRRFGGVLSNDDVRDILTRLPRPLSEIRIGYHSPRIKKTAEAVSFVDWLVSRGIISSWSETWAGDEIRINLFRR